MQVAAVFTGTIVGHQTGYFFPNGFSGYIGNPNNLVAKQTGVLGAQGQDPGEV